jgi:hypothetical protein
VKNFRALVASIYPARHHHFDPLNESTKPKRKAEGNTKGVGGIGDASISDDIQMKTVPPAIRFQAGRGNEPEQKSTVVSDISMSAVTSTKDLVAQGLMTVEDEQFVGSMSQDHQRYLLSPEGYIALRDARQRKSPVNFGKFKALPAAVLDPNPKSPSPLFRLAKNHVALGLTPAQYSAALRDAVDCGLFDVTQKGDQGRNPIHTAALYGCKEAIEIFADHDKALANEYRHSALNAEDLGRYTPLETVLVCAPNGTQYDAAKPLIDAGADLKQRHRIAGPVQNAVVSGDVRLVREVVALASRKGIPYGKDKTGQTPLKTLRLLQNIASSDREAIKAELRAYKKPAGRPPRKGNRFGASEFQVLADE